MTAEELRALDARVHREVMALECNCYSGNPMYWGYVVLESAPDGTTKRKFCEIPHYSTDIGAAWRVVEAMRGRFTNVSLHMDNGYALSLSDINDGEAAILRQQGPNAETAPLAICRAALMAVTPSQEVSRE